MIIDFKRQQLKNEAIKKVERHVSTYKPFENIIDIYVEMKLQEEQLKKQLEYHKEDNDLNVVLEDLKADIKLYEEQLLIN